MGEDLLFPGVTIDDKVVVLPRSMWTSSAVLQSTRIFCT